WLVQNFGVAKTSTNGFPPARAAASDTWKKAGSGVASDEIFEMSPPTSASVGVGTLGAFSPTWTVFESASTSNWNGPMVSAAAPGAAVVNSAIHGPGSLKSMLA